MKHALRFFRALFEKRHLMLDLAVRDFMSGYYGSTLGIAWAFIEPMIYMAIMYIFFKKALRYAPSGDAPYLPWLMSSMAVWTLFSGAIQASSTVFRSHHYLLKKWEFNMSILPVVSILSLLFVHAVFLFLLVGVFLLSGVHFSFYWFQFLYYLFALCVLILGVSWITASVNLFIKDTKNVISVMLQIGFWVSPIFWEIKSYPERYRPLIKLNPLYYIMTGYRNSFLYHRPFWLDERGTASFWIITLAVLGIGLFVYRKLRPYFGDVI